MLIRNSIRVTTPNSKYTVFNYIESYPHMRNGHFKTHFVVLYCNLITKIFLVSNSNNLIINKK